MNKTELERIYVIQPITKENAQTYKTLQAEAVSLIESAGAAYAGTIYQNVKEINAATFIGTGKLAELNDLLKDLNEVTVLFNGELSPSQTLNISAALENRKVIDRTTLILDIFAKNAKTSEGKLQVELAQLNYIYPRLKGKGSALSRLGGGVGTRGPGETQLETDRRYIRGRIRFLENRLRETEKRRTFQTQRRKKQAVRTIALTGYTNTGKSTLMNVLTDADVYVKNELFATLDPSARSFCVDGTKFLLVDTVGFLQDLPHHLIESFKSTLESALNCDLALIVCDATDEFEMQLKTTLDTLREMQFSSPYLVVMNKCENIRDYALFPPGSIPISAKEKKGIEALKRAIADRFSESYIKKEIFVSYENLSDYGKIKKYLTEQNVSYVENGLFATVVVPIERACLLRPYLTNSK